MNEPGSVGNSQGSHLVTGQETSTNKAATPAKGSAFSRSVTLVDNAKPQKGLRDVVRNFAPLPLYKFVVKLFSSNANQQKKLGQKIDRLRTANKQAWDKLGQTHGADGKERFKLQLACQESQLKLDYIEGRKTSPVTSEREKVVQALKEAVKNPSAESEQKVIKTFDRLKAEADHEIALQADLMLEKRKIPALKQRIAKAEPIFVQQNLENAGLKDKSKLSPEQNQIFEDVRDAQEELDVVKARIRTLKSEIQQFEKMQVDEDAAMDAYRRFGGQTQSIKKGR